MLPDGWSEAKLGNLLADIRGGGTPSKKNPDYWGGDIPWASVKDITNFHKTRTQDYITREGLNDSASNIIPSGTIIIATRMAVGNPVIFDCDVAINQDLKALFPKPALRTDFLFEWLKSAEDKIVGMASGSTVLGIRLEALRDLDILLPPLAEQKRIAEVLGAVDAALDATKAVINQTKTVKQGLLQTLLTRGIGHTKFKASPLGEIPESWEVKTIGDVLASCVYGISKSLSIDPVGTPILRMGNLQEDRLALSDLKYADLSDEKSEQVFLKRGDIVFNRTNSLDLVGKVALVDTDIPLGYASYLLRLRTNQGNSSRWLFRLMSSQSLQATFRDIATRGASQVNINPTKMRALEIAVPPLDEQERINEVFDIIDVQIDHEASKLTALQTLKKGLMDDLLTGRVRVGVSSEKATTNVVPFTLTAPVDAVRKHAVLAAEITAQLHHLPTFGATKREKLTDLVVRHVGLDETTDRQAARHAAGSYDPKARREIDDIFERENWFRIQRDTAVRFTKGSAFGGHQTEFEEQFGVVKQPIQKVINLLRDYDTRHCEIVDTLYVAWNDFLIEGKSPTDDDIITDVLTNWHASKRQIPRQDWRDGLAWMRARDFMPSGRGRSTKQKTLL